MRFLTLVTLAALGCGDKETEPTDTGTPVVDADEDGSPAGEDCDDDDPAAVPGGDEVCDEIDNDCDGATDEGVAADWFLDADSDGFGDAASSASACLAPDGYVSNDEDCDDGDAEVHPAAQDLCDGADNDCDDAVDETGDPEDYITWYVDGDGDGYGDDDSAFESCVDQPDHTQQGGDCDDDDPAAHPGAEEICDDVDNDCDGEADAEFVAWPDDDEDGYGAEGLSETLCDVPDGWVDAGGDCDDADPAVNPGAVEICDGRDNDCDGVEDGAIFEGDFDDAIDPTLWTLNGNASQQWDGTDGFIELTPATTSQAGTAFFNAPIPGDAWAVSFTMQISGGNAADGMAFAFLAESDPALLGTGGGEMGIAGYAGYAFEYDTYYNGDAGDPAGTAHYALMDVGAWSWIEYDTALPFRGDPVAVEILFDGGDYALWMDGAAALTGTLTGYAPGEILVGFGAGTGGLYDRHVVDDVTISCP